MEVFSDVFLGVSLAAPICICIGVVFAAMFVLMDVVGCLLRGLVAEHQWKRYKRIQKRREQLLKEIQDEEEILRIRLDMDRDRMRMFMKLHDPW